MTKKTLFIIPILLIAFYFYKQSNQSHEKQVSEIKRKLPEKEIEEAATQGPEAQSLKASPQVKDLEVVINSIDKEVSKSQYWDMTIDFTQSEREILAKIDAVKIYEHSKKVISNIASCIEDHCGLSADQDGYFDPSNTTADKLLARNLKLLNLVSQEAQILDYNLDEIDYDQIFASQNAEVQLEGIKLYLANNDSPDDLLGLIDKATKFKDETKGQFFAQMDNVTQQVPELRHAYVQTIGKMLTNENGNSIVEISENLSNLNLDIEELDQIMKSSCSIASQKIKKVLEVNFNDYIKAKNYNTNYNEVCP